eukprot:CAMPEP_0113473450 /NCGR_PEP_ID=MMETSP0014_2-20120614/18053_1 /TAXON_ID=2857 /ORGANISM="Nitzschia sp." /LENGTH=490 /DNA_ID=CAMNT_0000366223 /DNA_START=280 /DNA_END=1752 /DNA_ORIENTATION=- /assembly_acc=CAM_ASM_000159
MKLSFSNSIFAAAFAGTILAGGALLSSSSFVAVSAATTSSSTDRNEEGVNLRRELVETAAPSSRSAPSDGSTSTSSPSVTSSESSKASKVGQSSQTIYPDEARKHDATWLMWPHPYTYGSMYRNEIEPMWVEMTKALVDSGEPVVLVVYDEWIQDRATNQLWQNSKIDTYEPSNQITFHTIEYDDVWIRDVGPMFVLNENNKVEMIDWGFNGWGQSVRDYSLDNAVPLDAAYYLDMKLVDMTNVILEGGAVEVDGRGTLIATESSILENGRNRQLGWTQQQIENFFSTNMGVSNTIWLDGRNGGTEDITDYHIDGFARFANPTTIVTMNRANLLEWGISSKDVNTLYGAKGIDGTPFNFLYLPLTQNNVVTTYGENLGFKGSYTNFYTGNKVVMMPSYNDPNDAVAQRILQTAYPDRQVVLIDSRNAIKDGGMVHCVTKEQTTGMREVMSARNRQMVDALSASGIPSSFKHKSVAAMVVAFSSFAALLVL